MPFRPKKSAALYKRIWDGKTFPLISLSESFKNQLEPQKNVSIKLAYLLENSPDVSQCFDEWEKEGHFWERIIVCPLFPQYSESTYAAAFDRVLEKMKHTVSIPPLSFISSFHLSHAFIENSSHRIREYLTESTEHLILSFHGVPKRRFLYKGDPYYDHCFETFALLKRKVREFSSVEMSMCFQSRFGSEEWATPYLDEYIENLQEKGVKNIAVYCPSFIIDCLETIDEIGHELKNDVEKNNGHLTFIPCLNDDKKWANDFLAFLSDSKYKEQLELTPEEIKMKPEQKMEIPPLSPQAKKTLKIIFFTLFLDLVGFSIIFPLFPSLAKHYMETDPDNFFLKLIFDSIGKVMSFGGNTDVLQLQKNHLVLFGGALGGLYSFLQFLAAPIWGSLSDRIGRRPVLLISVFGLAMSYVLWFFSASFSLLIFARFIGGIMGGNISTASAVVADITEAKNRSKGMASIGVAFALGFIIGPAMGGTLSLIDLSAIFPSLKFLGVNPFSMPALLAALLSFVNLFFLYKNFEETLPKEKRGEEKTSERSANILALFKPLPIRGVNQTNIAHFLFLSAFSGMEFTLTFLAVERLSFSSMDNAYMFIYIGFLIALVQGGVVRRKAPVWGEKKTALMGLISLIPGLLLISSVHSSWMLYLGLTFLAIGSSLAIPCFTALVSLYVPAEQQGKGLGIFRSLGALARVVGPLLASVFYWRWGSSSPYYIGATFLIIPIVMTFFLPPVKLNSESL